MRPNIPANQHHLTESPRHRDTRPPCPPRHACIAMSKSGVEVEWTWSGGSADSQQHTKELHYKLILASRP